MRFKSCPQALKKFGFCGILALLYACRLPIPTNQDKFRAMLESMAAIIGGEKMRRWKKHKTSGKNKFLGGVTTSETLKVLEHYKDKCSYSLEKLDCAGKRTNVRQWLAKIAEVNTKYIVHTTAHAFFVHVGRKRGAWQLYDQGGRQTKKDKVSLARKGGVFMQKVLTVIAVEFIDIKDTAPSPVIQDEGSALGTDDDSDDDLPLQCILDKKNLARLSSAL